MALLDEKNLAAEAAKRARYRVHHVGTKLNQAELHELEVLAAKRKQTQAELIRRLVLREIEQDQTGLRPSPEVVEITACRLLLVNLLGPLAKGQVMTSEVFDGIVDLVKKQKARVALTGSKTTRRDAEPRWQNTLRCGSRRTEESAARERLDGYWNG
jgi:hypothetical protein